MTLRSYIAATRIRMLGILREAARTDAIMAFSTLCLLLVALIAAGISYFQWREMRAGGVDTHELAQAAKAQADATKAEADSMKDLAARSLRQAEATDKLALQAEKSATASIQSARDADVSATATKEMASISAKTLENAKQSVQLDQRAWLSVTDLRLIRFQVGSKMQIRMTFANSGRSPALHVSVAGALIVLDRKTEPVFLTVAPNSDFTALRAIAPQVSNEWIKDSDKTLQSEDRDEIEHFSRIVWAYGFLRYDDAFGTAHISQFCGYTRSSVASDKVVEGMELHLCPNQNGMN